MKHTIQIPEWAVEIYSDLSDWERHARAVNDIAPNGIWELDLPDDTYFEYCFVDAEGQMLPDPTNELKADTPWYPAARALTGPSYQANEYLYPPTQDLNPIERYKLDSKHLSGKLAERRRIMSYSPKGFENTPLPIVYIQDGLAYARVAQTPLVLETLLAEEKIAPAHLVFIEPKDRSIEYPYNPHYQSFVMDEVLPMMESTLAFDSNRIAMGASLGGLASGLLAWNYPEHFHTVISQSGAFLGSPEDLDYYGSEASWLLEQLQTSNPNRFKQQLSWYVDCGNLEWLADINKSLSQTLVDKGYRTASNFRNAGHNWVNWRNGLADALMFALPKI